MSLEGGRMLGVLTAGCRWSWEMADSGAHVHAPPPPAPSTLLPALPFLSLPFFFTTCVLGAQFAAHLSSDPPFHFSPPIRHSPVTRCRRPCPLPSTPGSSESGPDWAAHPLPQFHSFFVPTAPTCLCLILRPFSIHFGVAFVRRVRFQLRFGALHPAPNNIRC